MRYPSDLTDEEWEGIAPLLPRPSWRGRKPGVAMREVLNAIRYMALSGGGWRMLPKDFPPWQTVYWWFRRFVRLMDRERTAPGSQPECRGQRQPDGEGAGRHSRSLAQGHPLLQDRQASAREAKRRALGSLIDSRSSLRLIHFLMQKPTPTPKRTSTM